MVGDENKVEHQDTKFGVVVGIGEIYNQTFNLKCKSILHVQSNTKLAYTVSNITIYPYDQRKKIRKLQYNYIFLKSTFNKRSIFFSTREIYYVETSEEVY